MALPDFAWQMDNKTSLVSPLIREELTGQVFRFAVTRKELPTIRRQVFHQSKDIDRITREEILKAFDVMLPGDRTCYIEAVLIKPLSRRTAESKNGDYDQISDGVSAVGAAAVGGISGFLTTVYTGNPKVGKQVGAGVTTGTGYVLNKAIRDALPTLHENDVLFYLHAYVSGGIGPQVRSRMRIIKPSEYLKNPYR
ncbi:hypothetical protein ACFSJ3_01275 [Corallincola platygyrae]|uniref:Uncharacterized protein n=1 Tax=Corallincola platygyrae TaxID=1193278 RepID=A0ABW4XHR4_9GAMM